MDNYEHVVMAERDACRAELAKEQKRVAALLAIVNDLALATPAAWDFDTDRHLCLFCREVMDMGKHADTCTWLRAVEAAR